MFVDRVKIKLEAGKGGNGVIAWRREKFIPKGGPTGGNGGRGGDVALEADAQVGSLDWFRHRRLLKGENGGSGGSKGCHGKNGQSLTLKVPCGTVVKDVRTGEILADCIEDGQKILLCRGGRGGRGNESFKTPTHQAPHVCTPGLPGESLEVELELKLIADVGLVGFPNAGKSTLISTLAGLRVKIAAYPFTTLQPNLGFIELPNYRRLFLADIPGIIEGASQNRGLGIEFLRHIERTQLLIFVLDASGIDGRTPMHDFAVLREELGMYNRSLLDRPFLVALNKIDQEEAKKFVEEFQACYPLDVNTLFLISAAYGEGLEELLREMAKRFEGTLDDSVGRTKETD